MMVEDCWRLKEEGSGFQCCESRDSSLKHCKDAVRKWDMTCVPDGVASGNGVSRSLDVALNFSRPKATVVLWVEQVILNPHPPSRINCRASEAEILIGKIYRTAATLLVMLDDRLTVVLMFASLEGRLSIKSLPHRQLIILDISDVILGFRCSK